MNILAIDTSTDHLSIAVVKDGRTIAGFHKKADMRHSVLLIPTIDRLLKRKRLKLKDIGCFAISIGPGSFTGLRIGVTVVKGLAYSLNKPVVAVPTLDVIADNAAAHKGIICPVLDARKKKVYACIYKSDGKTIKRISKYLLLPAEELLNKLKKYDKVLFLGDTASSPGLAAPAGNMVKDWHPRAEVVAALALADIKKKRFTRAEDLEPMYIYSRECDIKGV
jgi:tRNA threonylcarbamoyladenosine biosynthesis protein TsaB